MNLKKYLIKSGVHISEIKNYYKKLQEEIEILGISSEIMMEIFIEESMNIFLNEDQDSLTIRFLKSGYSNFEDFIKSLFKEDGVECGMTVSTDFAVSDKPENTLDINKLHKDIEDKKKNE